MSERNERYDPDQDMGDDDQEWQLEEIEATGDYSEDYVDHVLSEVDDDGTYTISEEVREEDHGGRRDDEDEDESAEQAAIHIEEDR
ncbi:hypothetical protein J5X84_40555 [Streptosporangiaceae bacterium NEAU-GS5]|nr:hypothetical protein [Streptosporangiaceae bacterium NEAU-GS5]